MCEMCLKSETYCFFTGKWISHFYLLVVFYCDRKQLLTRRPDRLSQQDDARLYIATAKKPNKEANVVTWPSNSQTPLRSSIYRKPLCTVVAKVYI